MEYGLQMYCLRDITEKEMERALRETAKMGYKHVEFAGFFDYSAQTIKAWLDKYGLVCYGTHTGMDAIRPENIAKTIAYHNAIGCKNLIVPGADWSTKEKLDENIALLNEAQKTLAQAGICLGYHNHSGEFFTTEYGCIIEDEIRERTTVDLEIDTFWVFNAGLDPVATLESVKDRVKVIHLKDGIPVVPEKRNADEWFAAVEGKSVGEGRAPVLKVRDWAVKNGKRIVIESEDLQPTGLEEVARCMAFLKSHE